MSCTVLEAAIRWDEEAGLAALKTSGNVGVGDSDVNGWTALHHAAIQNLVSLCEALLAGGAQREALSRSDVTCLGKVVHPLGRTPLHCAAAAGSSEAARVLLEAGADVAALDVDGNTPLSTAALAIQARRNRLEDITNQLKTVTSPRIRQELRQTVDGLLSRIKLDELTIELLRAPTLAKIGADCSPDFLRKKLRQDALAGIARMHAESVVPEHLSTPYVLPGILSRDECERVLQQLETVKWRTDRHKAHATRDLPAREVEGFESSGWAYARIMEALRSVSPKHEFDPDGYSFRDLFFIRYDASAGGQPGLEPHRDGGLLSFNILISDLASFTGGGTVFYAEESRPDPPETPKSVQGGMLIHAGRMLHGAAPITEGVRIVLVGFLDVVTVKGVDVRRCADNIAHVSADETGDLRVDAPQEMQPLAAAES